VYAIIPCDQLTVITIIRIINMLRARPQRCRSGWLPKQEELLDDRSRDRTKFGQRLQVDGERDQRASMRRRLLPAVLAQDAEFHPAPQEQARGAGFERALERLGVARRRDQQHDPRAKAGLGYAAVDPAVLRLAIRGVAKHAGGTPGQRASVRRRAIEALGAYGIVRLGARVKLDAAAQEAAHGL
jgi:hypothetical protein